MFSHIFTRSRTRGGAAPQGKIEAGTLLPRFQRIVIPASGAPFSQRALKIACRLSGLSADSEIRLVYLIEVPRAFALAAPLPGEETIAENVLDEGLRIVRGFGCSATTEVQRGRDLSGVLLRYVAQQDVDLLILGSRPDSVRGIPLQLARDIYDRAPCRAILDYIGGDRRAEDGAMAAEGAAGAPYL